MGKPKLLYFDFYGWKTEPARLAYHFAGVDFEDVRLTREQQQEMKAKGELPFGQVPILYEVGKKTPLTQGTAIVRYVGRQTGFYPTDPWEGARIDEIFNLLEEAQGPIVLAFFADGTDEEKAARKKDLVEVKLPALFVNLEKLVKVNNEGVKDVKYAVGNKLTVADFTLWSYILMVKAGRFDVIPKEIADKYDLLIKIYNTVEADARTQSWKKKHAALFGLN